MYNSTPVTDKVLFAICALTFSIPALFFAFLTVKLIYLIATAEKAEIFSTAEMAGAAIGFPGMFFLLTLLARYFFRKAVKNPLN